MDNDMVSSRTVLQIRQPVTEPVMSIRFPPALTANIIEILNSAGSVMFAIRANFEVYIDPQASVDEMAKQFWDAVAGLIAKSQESVPVGAHSCKGQGVYMDAVDDCYTVESEPGVFWVGNGEYANRVNFCPFCGAKAPVQSVV